MGSSAMYGLARQSECDFHDFLAPGLSSASGSPGTEPRQEVETSADDERERRPDADEHQCRPCNDQAACNENLLPRPCVSRRLKSLTQEHDRAPVHGDNATSIAADVTLPPNRLVAIPIAPRTASAS
jgi:hypothetical protein